MKTAVIERRRMFVRDFIYMQMLIDDCCHLMLAKDKLKSQPKLR